MQNQKQPQQQKPEMKPPEQENWKTLPELPDYAISDRGRIKRVSSTLRHPANKVLRGSAHKDGYVRSGLLTKDGSRKNFLIHRLVLIAFGREPRENEEANHIDLNKKNNSIENLEWVTHQGNVDHAYSRSIKWGATPERSRTARLTREDALRIKDILASGKVNQRRLAREFNVSPNAISHIKHGWTWV